MIYQHGVTLYSTQMEWLSLWLALIFLIYKPVDSPQLLPLIATVSTFFCQKFPYDTRNAAETLKKKINNYSNSVISVSILSTT